MHAKLAALLSAVTAVYAPTATFAQGPARSSASMAAAASFAPAPGVLLNLRQFEIPFSVDSSGTRPVHVELFVSRDGGQQWTLFGRQPATGRHFQFAAPDDGQYWFATRTIDAAGNAHPNGDRIAPQLQVTVDTAEPQLSVQAEVDAGGRVLVQYVYADAAPAAEQVQVQYMTDTDRTRWFPVTSAGHQSAMQSDGTRSGRIQFVPEGNWRYLNVRLQATDRAGNQAVVIEQVEKPRVAGIPAQLASAPAAGGIPATASQPALSRQPTSVTGQSSDGGYAMHTPQPGAHGWPAAASPTAQAQPHAAGGAGAAYSEPGFRTWNQPQSSTAAPGPGGAPSLYATPVSQPTDSSGGFSRQAPSLIPPANNPAATGGPSFAAPSSEPAAAGPVPPSSAMRPISIETLPTPVGVPEQQYPTAQTPAAAPAAPPSAAAPVYSGPAYSAPAGETPSAASETVRRVPVVDIQESEIRQSRSRQFSLDYEVEAVGSKGIDEVELWGSSDGGQTWSNWGSDPDRQSPFDIETVNSGLYGFCIVVVGGNGLASRRPQAGDQADIYVRVDDMAPEVRVTAARYGQGDEAGALVIEYTYQDQNPVSRPISLAFSENPEGPWTTIATGLEATGRYAWPADPRLPRRIYLRIEGVDRAGNVGVEAPGTPVDVQGLAPKARIRGFQPILK